MVQYDAPRLDLSFGALSDATRRGVLLHLANGEASITELAERFAMSLTGIKKHVSLLEQAGLVVTAKVGRVRTCRMAQRPFVAESAWMDDLRMLWSARFDALDAAIRSITEAEKARATGEGA